MKNVVKRKTKRRKPINKKKTRSRNMVGGFPNPFGSSAPVKETTEQAGAPSVISKSNDANANAKNSILSLSTRATGETAALAATTALVGTAVTNLAYGAMAGLTASGVGIPLAGAIAGALLIANKLANMYVSNLKLFPIMYDSMSILSNCYKLNELIVKANDLLTAEAQSLSADPNSLVKKIRIDPEIKSHILEKVNEVTAFLLKIADDNALDALMNDEDIKRSGFFAPVEQEYKSRNKESTTVLGKGIGYLSKQSKKLDRGVNRFFYASDIRSDIVDNLSLINSFFIIIKTQYDFSLHLYEREFGPEKWQGVLKRIEESKEYQNYMLPPGDVLADAATIAKGEDEIGAAAPAATAEVVETTEELADERKEETKHLASQLEEAEQIAQPRE